MTPENKAEYLVNNFYKINCKLIKVETGIDMANRYNLTFPIAKQCALIAVDEVLSIPYLLKSETWFYNEVKKEIEKL